MSNFEGTSDAPASPCFSPVSPRDLATSPSHGKAANAQTSPCYSPISPRCLAAYVEAANTETSLPFAPLSPNYGSHYRNTETSWGQDALEPMLLPDAQMFSWGQDASEPMCFSFAQMLDQLESEHEQRPATTEFPFVEAYNDDNQGPEGVKAKIGSSLQFIDAYMPLYIEKPELNLTAKDDTIIGEAQVEELIQQQIKATAAVIEEAGFNGVTVTIHVHGVVFHAEPVMEADLPHGMQRLTL